MGAHPNLILVLTFGISVIMLVKRAVLFRPDKNLFHIYTIAFMMLFVSIYTFGSLSLMSIGNFVVRFLISYVAVKYDEDYFVERFVKMVVALSICSLLVFLLQLLDFNLVQSVLPVYYRHENGQVFYGGLLAGAVKAHATRNIGIATEPGRHQIYIVAALYFIMFKADLMSVKEKRIKGYLILLLITLLTTQSTTGYLALVILVLGFLMQKRRNEHRIKQKSDVRKKIKRTLLFLVFAGIIYFLLTGDNNIIYRIVIYKITDGAGNISFRQNTGSARVLSILIDTTIALKHPLGLGYDRYQEIWTASRYMFPAIGVADSASTTGLTSALAAFGFPVWIAVIAFYCRNAKNNASGIIETVMLLLLLINTSLAQPNLAFPPLIVIFLVRNHKHQYMACAKENGDRLVQHVVEKGNDISCL